MKSSPTLFLVIFLLAGCASHSPSFSGHPVSAFGPETEGIWQNQLTKGFGVKNKAIIRSVYGGIAELSNDNGATWNEAKVGTMLGENSILRTDPKASSDLFLGDNGPVIRLKPDTELRIVHLSMETVAGEKDIDTMLELPRGRILGNVKKLSAPSSYLIRTHGGIIQIRGTEFSASADGAFSIDIGSGVVYARGKTFEVSHGHDYAPPRR